MNDEKPNDHPGDMGFNDAPRCYTCSVCCEEYWNSPSLEGEHQMCDDCYPNTPIPVSGTVEPSWPKWISVKDRLPAGDKDFGHFGQVLGLYYSVWENFGKVIGVQLTHSLKGDEDHVFTHWLPLPPAPEGE